MQADQTRFEKNYYPGAPRTIESTDVSLCGGSFPRENTTTQIPNRYLLLFFILLGIAFVLAGFFFNTPAEILHGSLLILTSPANLLTDYFQLANIGATLVNVGFITLSSVALIRLNQVAVSGAIVAAIFTMIGFSFFGKNLFNTIPIILGVLIYSKLKKLPFRQYILHSMFGTAISPLVSEFSFGLHLPLQIGIPLGVIAGMTAGFILVPLSSQVLKFHQGYSLYNIGFTAGIIGMFFTAVLRGFGISIEVVSILSEGSNVAFSCFLFGLFALLFLLGLWLNRWRFTGFRCLFAQSGALPADFLSIAGLGVTAMNMAVMGSVSVAYVLALGGVLNGPVIGAVFTVVGFSAYGKHLRNSIPILVGVLLANLFNIHDSSATFAIIAALFGLTLAPIAGQYGVIAGILAGVLHMSLVTNIGFLHAGMNLYNNGFSGGFVAAFLYPLMEAFSRKKAAQ